MPVTNTSHCTGCFVDFFLLKVDVASYLKLIYSSAAARLGRYRVRYWVTRFSQGEAGPEECILAEGNVYDQVSRASHFSDCILESLRGQRAARIVQVLLLFPDREIPQPS